MTAIETIKKQIEEAQDYLNEMICQYEEAIDQPDFYDVALSREVMEEAQREYEYLKESLEAEKAWLAF